MAKNAVTDWSGTASSNTDVGGISINEGCPAPNINNAIREVMAQIADFIGDGPEARNTLGAIGNLHKITYLTSSGTHNFDSTTKRVRVRLVGGGGAGGGAPSTAGNSAAGAGGAGGGYAEKFFTLGAITSATITIGAAGTGSSNANGGNGGNTSYSDGTNSLTGNGGTGGTVGAASANAFATLSAAGGSASGGTIGVTGQPGGQSDSQGPTSTGTTMYVAKGGNGAQSILFGTGGIGSVSRTATSGTGNGTAGSGYGAGGGGGVSTNGAAAASGGNGAVGAIVIEEYN